MARKRWDKVTSSFLLRVDPFYNKRINDCEEFIPNEKVFFKQMYAQPALDNGSLDIDREIRKRINDRTKNIVICIKGYAGCGKSVYIQKLMHDTYPNNDNFHNNTYNLKYYSIHRLEIGAGTSSNDIVSRYIDDLSANLANGIKDDISVFKTFCAIIADNDDAIRYIDNELKLHDSFIFSKAIIECLDKSYQELKKAIRIELKQYNLSLLFAIDCLWRVAIHANQYQNEKEKKSEAMFFVCFDNLDAIDNINTCREFIKAMCEFRTNLDECMDFLHKDHKEYFVKTFTFIITCRNVTWGRLSLSEYAEDDDTGEVSTHLRDYDISGFYDYTDIVERRIRYYSKMAGKSKKAAGILNEMNTINKLNSMRYVKERFKPLFNFNYRKCIEVISQILFVSDSYVNEAIDLAEHDTFIAVDNVYSGSSSIFFRLVFDYFKSKNLFGYDIMGLVNLDSPYKNDCENRILTSQARIILMYLYSETKKTDGGKTRLDQIFEYFDPVYSLTDICDTIYNLFMRNTAWRRPINFSKRPLAEHKEKEDLYGQMELYKNTSNRDPASFTQFEICKAGEEYIEFVVAHFEFFACRASEKNQYLVPLFCKDSCQYIDYSDKYKFEITCYAVLDAVEKCCEKLSAFNKAIMEAKKIDMVEYLKQPIIKKTERNNPQLHEERVIFCHIYHLEAYRHYLINSYLRNEPVGTRADVNRRLVQIIKEYTNLYKKYIVSSPRDNVTKVLVEKIEKIESSRYYDFHTKIAMEYKSSRQSEMVVSR